MKTVVTGLMVVGALVLAQTTAAAGPCEPAIQARVNGQPASTEQMEQCLKQKPTLIVSGGAGLDWSTEGGFGGAFLTADVPMLAPLWLSSRFRYQTGLSKLDLLVGWRFKSSYGMDYDKYMSSETTATGLLTAMRSEWVLVAGLKAGFNGDGVDVGKTYQLGVQWHEASGFGGHKRIEAYAIARGSSFGGVVSYYNAIPPTQGFVFGMEAGFVPFQTDEMTGEKTELYWAIVDIGYSFEM